jgi:hypothetical protein
MKTRVDKTAHLVTGEDQGTTDEVARQRPSELLGLPVEKIGAYEFLKAVKKAQEDYKKTSDGGQQASSGMEAHEGVVRIDPYDK